MQLELMYRLFRRFLPVVGVCGLLIPVILGEYNLALLGSYLAIPLIIGPLIYTHIVRRQLNEETKLKLTDNQLSALRSIYFICYSISLAVLVVYEIRPLFYYFLITCMSICILLTILNEDINYKQKIITLSMLIALTLNILWGVNQKYYYFIGRTDIIGHIDVTESLLSTGYVTEIFGIYQAFPLWHILCTSVSNIVGYIYSAHQILFLVNGLVYSGFVVLVYLISIKITQNEKLSLIISLFTVFNPDFIYYGMSSISRSVTPFLMLLLIILLMMKASKENLFLSIITLVSLILFHPASMPFILSLFCMILVLQHIFKAKDRLFTLKIILSMSILTVGYWIYNADILFETIIKNIIREPPEGELANAALNVPLNELFNYLHYLPLLMFMIIGLLYVLNQRPYSKTFTILCLIGLISVIFAFPGPSLLINKFAADLNLNRFGQYVILFLSLVGGTGFFFLYSKSSRTLKLFAIVMFSCICLLGISNDFVASDNPLVERPFYTYYLTQDEITAFNHLAEISEGYIMSDYVSNRYLRRTEFESKRHILEVSGNYSAFLRGSKQDLILIREGELAKRPLKLFSVQGNEYILNPSWENSFDYYYADLGIWKTLDDYNLIYKSRSVSGFI